MDNEAKHRILFVCHGNICRSPMAEFVMKDLVKKAGLEDNFMIESAASSTEEEHPQHAKHLRWRPRREDRDADGLHQTAW